MAASAVATGAESCVSSVAEVTFENSVTGSLGLKSQNAEFVVLGIAGLLRWKAFCSKASRRRRGPSRGVPGGAQRCARFAAAARRGRPRVRGPRHRGARLHEAREALASAGADRACADRARDTPRR